MEVKLSAATIRAAIYALIVRSDWYEARKKPVPQDVTTAIGDLLLLSVAPAKK